MGQLGTQTIAGQYNDPLGRIENLCRVQRSQLEQVYRVLIHIDDKRGRNFLQSLENDAHCIHSLKVCDGKVAPF